MFCTSCGNLIPESGRVCSQCGAEQKFGAAEAVTGVLDHYKTSGTASMPGERNVSDLVGQIIDSKYRLDAELGRGEMGVVYRATRLLIGDAVAVKIILPEHVADQKSVQRFRREAQATALLKHPNAVAIYDFGTTNEGLVYLVMELVEGQSLRQIIREQGQLSPLAASIIVTQVCAALDDAHRRNIVHGDVKPDNIVITTTTGGVVVKVMDFGLAKLFDPEMTASEMPQAAMTIGAPHYMSPEQLLGEGIDGRSDIYSLGIVIYEMLTGAVPFSSPTATAVIVQHVNQVPPSMRTKSEAIPPAVESVVMRALEKRPDARQQSALILAQELSAAVKGETPRQQVGVPQVTERMVLTPSTQAAPLRNTIPNMIGETPPPGGNVFGGVVSQPPATAASDLNGGIPNAGSRKRLWTVVIAAVVVLGLVGGAAAWWQMKRSDQQKQADQKLQSNSAPEQSENQSTSAEGEIAELRDRRRAASSLEIPKVNEDIKAAEIKYPADYRFPYERAKIHIEGVTQHNEHFLLLKLAGQKAIENGKTDEMLSDLERDKNSDFKKLSKGHEEWNKLLVALTNKDNEAIKHVAH